MKTLVVAPNFYSDQNQIHRLRDTANYFNIQLTTYGEGQQFSNWVEIKLNKLADFLFPIKHNYELVLYVDGGDSWFLTGLDEIINKFMLMKIDLLVAGEKDCYPLSNLYDVFPKTPYKARYINCGGYLGYIDYFITQLEILRHAYGETDSNDQAYWIRGLADGKISYSVDSKCEIFQCLGGISWETDLIFNNGRVYNKETDSYPCILHNNGVKIHMGEIYNNCLKERNV